MKKMLAVLFVAAIVVAMGSVASADWWSWKGEGSGSAETWNKTELEQGKFWTDGARGSFQTSVQGSSADLSLSGREYNPDKVVIVGEASVSSGYKQFQHTPGGFQESWGRQNSEITGTIKSR